MPEQQKPSVGRIVHFGFMDSSLNEPVLKPRAAIITLVPSEDGVVSLLMFDLWGTIPHTEVPFSSTLKENCWTWPPRV